MDAEVEEARVVQVSDKAACSVGGSALKDGWREAL
jgi:hypothetical protein